jgi:hypothetical protein
VTAQDQVSLDKGGWRVAGSTEPVVRSFVDEFSLALVAFSWLLRFRNSPKTGNRRLEAIWAELRARMAWDSIIVQEAGCRAP